MSEARLNECHFSLDRTDALGKKWGSFHHKKFYQETFCDTVKSMSTRKKSLEELVFTYQFHDKQGIVKNVELFQSSTRTSQTKDEF